MVRQFTFFDHVLSGVDTAVRTIYCPKKRLSQRQNPGQDKAQSSLTTQEKRHIAGLMRVNHAGEVCAQALYQGQAATAQLTHIKAQMTEAAKEEVEHLAWCEQRLQELNSRTSYLNIFWYSGSFLLGAVAGLAGDRWSLGFVAETERQVTRHLKNHIKKLPESDLRTKAILLQMQEDEERHSEVAIAAGAFELPFFIKQLMHNASKLMTYTSYYL